MDNFGTSNWRILHSVVLDDISALQQILIAVQIFSMDDWNNACRIHKVCSELKLDDHLFVCDKDSIITEKNDGMKKKQKTRKT